MNKDSQMHDYNNKTDKKVTYNVKSTLCCSIATYKRLLTADSIRGKKTHLSTNKYRTNGATYNTSHLQCRLFKVVQIRWVIVQEDDTETYNVMDRHANWKAQICDFLNWWENRSMARLYVSSWSVALRRLHVIAAKAYIYATVPALYNRHGSWPR